jgi:transcriptional regulator with GAF, ATPase, and Fis domain
MLWSVLWSLLPALCSLFRDHPNRSGPTPEVERDHILQALRSADWVVGGPHGAAVLLGVKRTTLLHKMRRLGIKRPPDERPVAKDHQST